MAAECYEIAGLGANRVSVPHRYRDPSRRMHRISHSPWMSPGSRAARPAGASGRGVRGRRSHNRPGAGASRPAKGGAAVSEQPLFLPNSHGTSATLLTVHFDESHREAGGFTLLIFGAIAPKGEGPSRGKPVPAVEITCTKRTLSVSAGAVNYRGIEFPPRMSSGSCTVLPRLSERAPRTRR